MLAENEGDACSFSPLSPGCMGTSRKLQELFGLFRDESLARPGSQAHDALLSQVRFLAHFLDASTFRCEYDLVDSSCSPCL